MATMENDILFNININDAKALDALTALRKSQTELKNEIKKLNDIEKENGTLTKEQNRQREQARVSLKNINDEVKLSEKILDANSKQVKKNEKNFYDYTRELSNAKAQLKSMTQEELKSAKADALRKKITDLRKLTESFSSDIGENQFAVGRYTEGIEKAFANFGVTGADSFKEIIGGAKNMGAAMMANPALIALNIMVGLFAVAQKALSSFEPLVEFFERKMAAITATWNSLKDGIVELFSGNFASAWDSFTTGATNAANKAERLKRELQAIEDLERESILTNASLRKLAADQEKISKDATKSKKEQKDALLLSLGAEQALFKNELDFAKKRAFNRISELSLLKVKNDKEKEEELKLRASLIDMEANYVEQTMKASKRLSDFNQEEREKQAQLVLKLNELKTQNIQDTNLKELTILKNAYDKERAEYVGHKEILKQLEIKYINDKQALIDKQTKEAKDKQAANDKAELDKMLKINADIVSAKELELKQLYTSEENYQKGLTALKQSKLETDLQILRAYYGTEAEIQAKQNELNNFYADQNIAKQKQVTAEIEAENKKRIESEQQYQAVLKDGINSTAAIFGEMLINMEQSNEQFQKALVLTFLDTTEKILQLAILQIFAEEIRKKSFAGIATATLLSGLLKGLFAGVKSKVSASYYNGGYTGDGDTTAKAGQVEYGEYVINNRDLRSIGGVAAVESILPSRKFASALPITNNLSGAINNNNQFAEALKNLKVITTIEAIDKVASQEAARINYSKF